MLINYGIQNVIERITPVMTPLHPGRVHVLNIYRQIQFTFAYITCLIYCINMSSVKKTK